MTGSADRMPKKKPETSIQKKPLPTPVNGETARAGGQTTDKSHRRKEGLIGLLLMILAGFVFLALYSYHHAEQPETIWPRRDAVQNLLGPLGAYVAFYLFNYGFGMASFVFPLVMGALGLFCLTRWPWSRFFSFVGDAMVVSFLISLFFAIPFVTAGHIDFTYSGLLGGVIAAFLFDTLGTYGSYTALILASLFCVLWITRFRFSRILDVLDRIEIWWMNRRRRRESQTYAGAETAIEKKNQSEPGEAETTDSASQDEVHVFRKEILTSDDDVDFPTAGDGSRDNDSDETDLSEDVSQEKESGDDALRFDTRTLADLEHLKKLDKLNLHKVSQSESVIDETQPHALKDSMQDLISEAEDLAPKDEATNGSGESDDGHETDTESGLTTIVSVAHSSFDEEIREEARNQESVLPVVSENESDPLIDEPDLEDDEEDQPTTRTGEKDSGGRREEIPVAPEVKEKSVNYDDLNRMARSKYKFPSVRLLANHVEEQAGGMSQDELRANAEILESKLSNFKIEAKVVKISSGPVITLYELKPAAGVKVSSIVNLEDDLAMAMKARGIRIVAPIPGKGTVGIEIANRVRSLVSIKSIINTEKFRSAKSKLTIALGKTITGEVYCADLGKMPHLLIAGATGAGKSVGINTIIASLLYRSDPSEVKFVMIDPKKLELALYKRLVRHHLIPLRDDGGNIVEDVVTTPDNAKMILNMLVREMEIRYERLAQAGVRDLKAYNEKVEAGKVKNQDGIEHTKLEYIVAVIDELADLMMTSGKEVEEPIARIAQMARAIGIHLILATQRPSVDVLTGVIKSNFPARISYQTASKIDSRTILDMGGAEKLLGGGDMLFLPPGQAPIRLQNAFISTEETEQVVDYISRQQRFPPKHLPIDQVKNDSPGGISDGDRDSLFNEAVNLVVNFQQGSASFLQRKLRIGYSRAARLIDQLEDAGIVGPFDGSKARDILIEPGQIDNYLN